jgi:hypothetical protein
VTDVEVQTEAVGASTPQPLSRPAAYASVRTACAAALGGGILIALAAAVHVWFAPFVVGVAIGATTGMWRVRARTAVIPAVVAAVGGWAVVLLWRAVAGQPVVATAQVVAALSGLSSIARTATPTGATNAGLAPTGWLVIAVCLLVAAGQGLLGVWWARSLTGLPVARQHREKIVSARGR